ncbi:AAA family ATPase [Brevibacillus ginsengisoli]|uniref:AAA family ATPase n=1 Tax=Brevibacillus ginsengisoli TaxID=363854 RepID=UPI003CE78C3D
MYLRSLSIQKNIPKTKTKTYPFSIPAIRNLEEMSFRNRVTFFVGENGSGKSTLLEGIAYQCGFNTAGGGRNNLYEVQASHSDVGEFLRLSWLPKVTNGFFMRAETFYNFASYLDTVPESLQYYGGRSLHEQSHGESFLSLFRHRFGGRAVFLLDEPEAALSPARQLSLLKIMKDLEKDTQFIIATHSPILLAYPGAQIFTFDTSPIAEITYEETLHYQLTRRFLLNTQAMLEELFAEDEEDE